MNEKSLRTEKGVPVNNRNFSLRSALFLGAATAAALSISVPASAAETETVTVTGTRIPVTSNIAAPTAVTTISSENLQMTGSVNVADILRTVPSFGVSGLSTANSNFFTTSAGMNTLELRNLGESRTLVLVNGVRHVAGASGSSAVDFNTVPTDMIDHIDVITGGASAIYGSDALAGVVNVILKKDFEGVTGDVEYGISGHSDDITYKVSATMGGNFGNNKGNAWISGAWTRNEGAMASDHGMSLDNSNKCPSAAAWAKGADINLCKQFTPGTFSSYSAYGWFTSNNLPGVETIDNGKVVDFSTSQYGFNRQPYRSLETPLDRLVISSGAHYDITPSIQAYMNGTFADTSAHSNMEPYAHVSTDLSTPGISIDNPFVPTDLRDMIAGVGDDHIYYRRRLVEFGPRQYTARRNTYQLVTGLKGTIFNDYNWDAYFDWGHTLDTQSGTGQINVPNMRESIDARTATADDVMNQAKNQVGALAAIGDIVCNHSYAQTEGCVPVNIFGKGSITQAAVGYLSAPQSRVTNIDQQVIGATISGPVFELPAGKVNAVAGFEYRREYSSDVPDALTQTGQNGGNKEEPTTGGYHVTEFFTEVEAPILKDLPFAQELSVGGAWRWSQYNTTGVTNAYTGRVSWAPLEELRFRGQYAKAVRAPDINELYAPGGEDFAEVSDPCDGITAADTSALATRCKADPGIAARINSVGAFNLTLAEKQGTGGMSGRGNQQLKPEKSDSWSVGTIFQHDFTGVGSLTASVDYFSIDVQNYITTLGRQQAIDLCYGGTAYPSEFCNHFVRDHGGNPANQGEITAVNVSYINEGYLKTSGVDFSVSYQFDLNDFPALRNGAIVGLNDAGQIGLRTNWTWLQSYTSSTFGEIDPQKGSLGAPTHKVQLGLLYSNGPVSIQWETDYQAAVRDSGNPTSGRFYALTFGDYWTSDLSGSYQVTENFQLYGGVKNIMDHPAPMVLSGVPGNTTGANTDQEAYDSIGRRYFFGARVKF